MRRRREKEREQRRERRRRAAGGAATHSDAPSLRAPNQRYKCSVNDHRKREEEGEEEEEGYLMRGRRSGACVG